MNVEIDETPAI